MLRLRFVFLLLAAASAISAQTGNQLPRVTLKKMVKVFINTQYAAKTKIDTREYLLVMDTSSCNTITASEECVGGSCVCPNVRRFHSHNFKLLSPKAEEVTFFDTGRAVGKAVEVPMSIDELTSPKQGVVVADELSQEVCILSADGVVGMAPPGCSNHFNLETVFGNFVKQGQIAPIFSVHHGSIAGGNTQALIDTSKSIIVGPEAQISNINKAIGCTPVQKSGLNICEGKLCYSGLQPSNIDHYQIGDYFIDHYYIEFNWDKKMIGVVESRD
ncbi:Aspartic protease Bla g 2 [Blattella germanica]|nr:Aspartic protease Bla g 2 [Blattella germanica]